MTCETDLAQAQAALHALMTGEQVVSVTTNGRTTQYNQTDVEALRTYVKELQAECGPVDANGNKIARRGAIMFRG